MIDGIKQQDEHQTKRGLSRGMKNSLVYAATSSFYVKRKKEKKCKWKIQIQETNFLYTYKYCTMISLEWISTMQLYYDLFE